MKRAMAVAAILAVGFGAGMLARDLTGGRPAEAQEAERGTRARFQVSAVGGEKGGYAVFVVNQENGDLWRHDSSQAGYVKVAGPIK